MTRSDDLIGFFQSAPLTFVSGWSNLISQYCPVHLHPCFEIVYHPSGRGETVLANGERIAFGVGDVVIYPPYQRHDQTMAEAGLDVCIQAAASGILPKRLRNAFHLPALADNALKRELLDLAQGRAATSELDRLALGHRVTAVMIRLVQSATAHARAPDAPPAQRHAERARRHIAEHYRTIGSIEEVASQLDLGYDHLRHVFRQRYRRSLVRWLAEVRVERAKELLVHSNLPLKTVAEQCGYGNERYFSTAFKKLTGMPPGGFRRST